MADKPNGVLIFGDDIVVVLVARTLNLTLDEGLKAGSVSPAFFVYLIGTNARIDHALRHGELGWDCWN